MRRLKYVFSLLSFIVFQMASSWSMAQTAAYVETTLGGAPAIRMGGVTTSVVLPERNQLRSAPPMMFIMTSEYSTSIASENPLSRLAEMTYSLLLSRRGATVRYASDYHWFSRTPRIRFDVIGAAQETRLTEQPVDILVMGSLSHIPSMKKLRLDAYAVSMVDSSMRGYAEQEVSYPPLEDQ